MLNIIQVTFKRAKHVQKWTVCSCDKVACSKNKQFTNMFLRTLRAMSYDKGTGKTKKKLWASFLSEQFRYLDSSSPKHYAGVFPLNLMHQISAVS